MTSNFNLSISEPGANGAQISSAVSDRGRTVTIITTFYSDVNKLTYTNAHTRCLSTQLTNESN